MLFVVDSIEHFLAICTLPDGRSIDVPLAWLPKDTNPGDHLEVLSDGERLVQLSINIAVTQELLEQNRQALGQLGAGHDAGRRAGANQITSGRLEIMLASESH